jgi:hypothetical protein
MHKTMSEKQLEANRLNAQKSTGPITEEGKAVVSMNAIKHGLLSTKMVVHSNNLQESADEFRELCLEFYTDIAPKGALEVMLTDQIIQATWRLRRARMAETGEIALSVDSGCKSRDNKSPMSTAISMISPFSAAVGPSGRPVSVCEFLLFSLGKLRENVERDGELTKAVLEEFKSGWYRHEDDVVIKLKSCREWLAENPEKLEPDALRARHKEEVLKFLAHRCRLIEFERDQSAKLEEVEEQARKTASILPSPTVLEKILNYESVLQRQLFKSINQLESLQRRRKEEEAKAGRKKGRRRMTI